jgi:hypothetical protein
MHPHGLDAHRWLGPLTDPAFVRRAALERDGLRDPELDTRANDGWRLSLNAWLAAAWSRCVDGARAWSYPADSAQPREGKAGDQRLF